MFYFLHELKQRISDVTGRHQRQVDSDVTDVTEAVETARPSKIQAINVTL